MKSTSPRSVKVIPKTDDVADTSGTQPTEETSETISGGITQWIVQTDSKVLRVSLPGSNGRVSVGHNPRTSYNEARFYVNGTTKTFDVYLPGVVAVWTTRAIVEDMPKSEEEIEEEQAKERLAAAREAKRSKEALERLTSAIVSREYEDGDDDSIVTPW